PMSHVPLSHASRNALMCNLLHPFRRSAHPRANPEASARCLTNNSSASSPASLLLCANPQSAQSLVLLQSSHLEKLSVGPLHLRLFFTELQWKELILSVSGWKEIWMF
ncbi:putative small proline-rich protein 2J, partial [Cricetulus griseus]